MLKDVQTTEDYWDCECVGMPDEYIHPKSQLLCIECGQHQDDMPDSRIDEVAQMNIPIKMCKDCLRSTVTLGLDSILINQTFTIVDISQCCKKHTDSDGFPICHNDCANWPWLDGRCGCECHDQMEFVLPPIVVFLGCPHDGKGIQER